MIPTWGKPSAPRKTSPGVTLSTANPIQSGLKFNAVRRGERGWQRTAWAMTPLCVSILTCFNYVAVFNRQKKTVYIYFSMKTGFVSSARNSFCTFYFT